MTAIAIALGGLAGLIAGSFLATLVVRWPETRTLRGRSACDSCSRALRWFELVPLASWIVQRGACRRCGVAIDRTHPTIEALCAAVGIATMVVAPGVMGAFGALFGWLLVALAVLDLRHFWLPDRLTATVAATGLIASITGFGPLPIDSAIGGLIGFLSLAAIAWIYRRARGREGLGGGDPKLFGAIGIWLGWQPLPFVLLGASATGLLGAVVLALAGRPIAATTRMPFGTLLGAAGFIVWLVTR